jgi:hypothetical protein
MYLLVTYDSRNHLAVNTTQMCCLTPSSSLWFKAFVVLKNNSLFPRCYRLHTMDVVKEPKQTTHFIQTYGSCSHDFVAACKTAKWKFRYCLWSWITSESTSQKTGFSYSWLTRVLCLLKCPNSQLVSVPLLMLFRIPYLSQTSQGTFLFLQVLNRITNI